jgi:hypothetical protein
MTPAAIGATVAKRRRAREAADVQPSASLQPEIEEIAPGEFRVRVHRNWDPTRSILLRTTPYDIAHERTMQRLRDSSEPLTTRQQRDLKGLRRSKPFGES